MPEAGQRRRIATVISPDVLDQIGKDFRFNHGKGAVEWLKNSLDAYLVRRTGGLEEESGGWPVHLHLIDGRRGQTGPNLAVLDFAGASYDDVQNFLLTWFDTSAATRGNRTGARGLTGGHGNGGKFYMREMWRRNARFCTYLDGRASSLVVDRASDGTCGYWEHEAWLRERIGACAAQAEAESRERQRRAELDAASALNQTLNDYARTFLRELETEVFVDWLDEEGGGEGGDGAGAGGGGRGNGAGGGSGEGGGRRDAPGDTQRVRRPRFPRILLSGHDEDPAEPGASRALSPSHPPIHQNDDDARRYNVWWINTSHPYASEAMSRGGVGGRAWKEYHFFMFRDIVQIEHLRMLQRRDSEMALDQLENELIQRSSDFLSRITQDIAEQILD